MAKDIHVGDVGTIFEVIVVDQAGNVVNLAGATTTQIKFTKPDGTQTAVLSGDGSDGAMRYITIANDLDADGGWFLQGYVVKPVGSWHSDIGTFPVQPSLS